eukprot:CAMPEP_0174734212 /NCGR_PEP_ID=MMETSP1094-20130205/62851_1 /TAXON_ID=156173 /ORGANISM="Chrysochromulina brevifilum, Strain UTEX LB 985" /LENGTH=287 /DNA_ID=CAMNT_0015936997 /DNA_START=97 /DNA_END=960 /DNA_ORIENTATION=-
MKAHLESAIAGIGNAVSATVQGLTDSPAKVVHTPVGEPPEQGMASLPKLNEEKEVRIKLVDEATRVPWRAFDVFLDVNIATFLDSSTSARGVRDAIIDALADVKGAAVELLETVAHGELIVASSLPLQSTDTVHPPPFWAKLYIQVLYAQVANGVRTAISLSAVAEMKQYKKPPKAVVPVLTATLALLAEGSTGSDALPPIDRNKLTDWAGVRSVLLKIEPDDLIRAIVDFDPTKIRQQLWAKVNSLLEQASLRDAMRSSAPLGALYRWIKCGRLLSKPDLLLRSSG